MTALVDDTRLERQRYRFTVSDFHRMSEQGILPADARLELIDGEITLMSAMNPRHANAVARLTKRLERAYGESAYIWPQCPLVLSEHDEPYPDVALLRGDEQSYENTLPNASNALLVIEVSDSTLRDDRIKKIPRYAAAGVPEVWILNLQDNQLEVYRDPKGTKYRSIITLEQGQIVSPLEFEDVKLEWW